MSDEKCIKCGNTEGDLRTLRMWCLYEMNELGLPFSKEKFERMEFYTLRVCKRCRADWMKAIKDWFNTPRQSEDSCESGIYIREYGALKEVTREEFDLLKERGDGNQDI